MIENITTFLNSNNFWIGVIIICPMVNFLLKANQPKPKPKPTTADMLGHICNEIGSLGNEIGSLGNEVRGIKDKMK